MLKLKRGYGTVWCSAVLLKKMYFIHKNKLYGKFSET